MSLDEFEARYRADPDPWGYLTSDYEREKYAATLAACGEGRFADAIELGSSIGVFSELLAPRCDRLTTVDAAPTAVGAARRRLAGAPHVRVVLGAIPETIPDREFAVHWRPPGPERPLDDARVHRALSEQPWLTARATSAGTDDYELDALGRR